MVFPLTALLIAAADQLTKIWIRSSLALGQSIPDTGFFQLTYIHNTGAVFGLFRDQSFLLTIVASVGVVFLLLYAFFIHRQFPFLNSMLGKLALGLILGGTVGNLIDRLRFGYVTDFISVGIWPVFNIADSAVTVGAIVVAYSLLRLVRAEKH
ncbi:signal peptidase II [Chloroflexota bacterium]